MNKAELIVALEMILDALKGNEEAETVKETKPAKADTKSTKKKEAVQKEEKEEDASGGSDYSEKELMEMRYNDLKKLGASLGVSCKGTRDEIVERILNLSGADSDEDDEEEEKPVKEKAGKTTDKKSGGKKKEKEPEPEDEDSDEDEEKDWNAIAEEVIKEMGKDDVKSALEGVGVVVKKTSNLVKLLAKALEDKLINLDDEDEGEADSEDEEDSDEGEEITPESYFEDFDLLGVNNPKEMSKKRKKAVVAKMKEIISGIESEEISETDITDFIDDFASDEEKELVEDEDDTDSLIMLFMEISKRFIDDDGEEHEPKDCYDVQGKSFCCGQELKFVKKGKKYVCSVCGEEYSDD